MRGFGYELPFKASGVEWLGDIPEHWEVRRLKSAVKLVMGQSPSSEDCSDTPLGLPFLQGCAEFGAIYPEAVQFCVTPPRVAPSGAILMSVRAPVGRLNIADQDYGIGRGLCGVFPDNTILLSDFAYYQFEVLENALQQVSTGSTYQAVTTGDIGTQVIVLPPHSEQSAIVDYLDNANLMLRGGVSQKQELVELMEEYKRAVIQQTVTRGLDPDVPLKPSGVEWLGDIPEHWEMYRIKSVMSERSEKGYPSEPLLSATQARGVIRQDSYENRTVLAMKDLHLLKRVQEGDFVISLRSFQGGIEFARDSGIISPAYTILYPKNSDDHGYLAWLFKSAGFIENLRLHVTGIREGQNIDYERLSRSFIPLPPLPEQAAIAAYLDNLTSDIDAAIARTRREIELLEEYRTRLIADVVTGKLDVREVTANYSEISLGDS